jgi:ABC-type multidrug transport system ATPase subunit
MRVALANVTKRYGRTRALDDFSLALEGGQIVAVLGINGAGKTTLLRALAGVVAPERGQIEFDGEPFRLDRLDQRRRLWFLPDFPPLLLEEPVLTNIGLILRLFEADQPGVEERALELLRELDLVGLVNAPVGTLSRGQIYKTALTILVCVDPELWLLDEPFASGMDPVGIGVFRREARDATERGRLILYSTQWLDAVERLADRLCILHSGKLRAFGTLAELQGSGTGPGGAIEELFRRFSQVE